MLRKWRVDTMTLEKLPEQKAGLKRSFRRLYTKYKDIVSPLVSGYNID